MRFAEEIGSTVPRRQLGRLLRQFRTEAGVTLDAAAEALEYSRQKIWRMESGLGSVRVLDVKAMCELYNVAPEMTEAMRGLAAETRSKGWWHAYGDAVPSWFELYVGLEAAASHLRRYDEALIPGLLQTKEYAHVIYLLDRSDASDEERERAVEVRLQRQSLLTRRLPKAPAGSFVILDFPPGNGGRAVPEPSVAYRESLTGALYLDKPEELAAYEKVWQGLSVLALDEGQSKRMIKAILSEAQHD